MNNTYQVCGMLNRVFAAYFLNQCGGTEGIDFEDSKPVDSNIALMNTEGHYYVETDSPYGLKHFFHGRMHLEKFDLEKFLSMRVEEYIDAHGIIEKLEDIARYFSQAVKTYQSCDFVFSSLPDAVPFIYDCLLDPESNFRSRIIIGKDLASNEDQLIWEFYGLLMNKIRKTEVHPIYGQAYKNVDAMTPEEREKYCPKLKTDEVPNVH